MVETDATGGVGATPRVVTVAERYDLLDAAWESTKDLMPEYNNHGDVLNEYWPRLTEELPGFQFHLLGDDDEIVARARSIPSPSTATRIAAPTSSRTSGCTTALRRL